MDFPTDINQWDYSTIYRLVTQRDAEPGMYDFKEVLNARGTDENKKELNDSIRKTVCSMANADGGYIIFGVKDPKKHPNLTVDQRFVGIPKSSEYLKEFGDKISSIQRNVPCVYPDRLIDVPDNIIHGIFVVHIPLSPLRPHMIEGTFYKRASTESMDWYEVRDQMLYTEGRLQKVRLLRLKIAQFKKLRASQLGYGYDWERQLAEHSRYETHEFEALVADTCDLIPSQTDLLEKLLDLARAASMLNAALDHTIPFTPNDRNVIRAKASNLLGELCEECEKQLAEIFGPLLTDKI
jgi:Putative DNA-binding domain